MAAGFIYLVIAVFVYTVSADFYGSWVYAGVVVVAVGSGHCAFAVAVHVEVAAGTVLTESFPINSAVGEAGVVVETYIHGYTKVAQASRVAAGELVAIKV